MTQTEKEALRDYIVSYLIANSQTINGLPDVTSLDGISSFPVVQQQEGNKYIAKKVPFNMMITEFRYDSGYIQYKDLTNGTWINIISDVELAEKIDLSRYVNVDMDQIVNGIKTFNNSPIVPDPITSQQVTNKGYVDSSLLLKVDKTSKIISGDGLIGGGDLSSDLTINIESANDGILINPDNIQLQTVDNLNGLSPNKPLSSLQGKILNDTKVDKSIKINNYQLINDISLSKSDIGLSNVDNTSDVNKPISESTQNALNLKADLVNGQIPASQLPSYVDDILEYPNLLAFPLEGENGKLYIDLQYNLTYRWSGSIYVEVSKSLALGETDSTAYRGDRGKSAYDHSLLKDNPHSVTKSQVGLGNVDNTSDIDKPISTNTQTVLNTKADKAITIIAGKGLTGGGDLSSNKTIDIASANEGITVNADNIQLNTIDNLTSTSAAAPLSANQGKVLNETKADKTTQVVAGNGLTGGGALSGDVTVNVVNTDDSIVVGADGIKVDTQNSLTSTSTTKPLSAAQGKVLQDNKVDASRTITAGNGLTGGGSLTEDRTIDINPADDSLTVTTDNVKVNTNNTLTSTSTTQPLSANQGKVLNEKVAQVETDLSETTDKLTELEEQVAGISVYTDKINANKVIKELYINLGNYLYTKCRASLSREGETGKWGLMLYLDNVAVWHWWDSELSQVCETYNGIFMYAKLDWSQMEQGSVIYEIHFTNAAFAPNSDIRKSIKRIMLEDGIVDSSKIADLSVTTPKIYDSAITMQKLADASLDVSKMTKSTLKYLYMPTDNMKFNKCVKRFYLDTSNYYGSLNIDGLYISAFARNVDGLWGVILRNSNEEYIYATWMNSEQPLQIINLRGLYMYIEYDWTQIAVGVATYNCHFMQLAKNVVEDPRLTRNVLFGKLYGQVGDSISEGVGLVYNLPSSDAYNPIEGAKKATYGYHIAKNNGMEGWYNYGKSGTTLGDVSIGNEDRNGFSKENGRYTQMADNLDYISIFFGWNDAEYGPRMRKQMWVQETYGNNHLYPARNDAQYIGTDGYCTQEEYDAVNAVTGEVGGITYNTPIEYWNAKYIGTSSDNTNKTWWGAWNIILPYLIEKYPLAKILIILPYSALGDLFTTATKDAAKKWGVSFYDWKDSQLFEYNNGAVGTINGIRVDQFRRNNITYDGLHPNEKGYRYMYSAIEQRLLSI